MKETHEYLVPDYYPEFQCKMGACRHSCCEGWPVTVSLEDYYHLLNVECGEELRRRIGDSLYLLPYPTQDEYAEISHDYTGKCRLRMGGAHCMRNLGKTPLFRCVGSIRAVFAWKAITSAPVLAAMKKRWSFCLNAKRRSALFHIQ